MQTSENFRERFQDMREKYNDSTVQRIRASSDYLPQYNRQAQLRKDLDLKNQLLDRVKPSPYHFTELQLKRPHLGKQVEMIRENYANARKKVFQEFQTKKKFDHLNFKNSERPNSYTDYALERPFDNSALGFRREPFNNYHQEIPTHYPKEYIKEYQHKDIHEIPKDYIKDYSKDYVKNYPKDYPKDYAKDYTKDYTKDYVKDYAQDYAKALEKTNVILKTLDVPENKGLEYREYHQQSLDRDSIMMKDRQLLLKDRRVNFGKQIKNMDERINSITHKYGLLDLKSQKMPDFEQSRYKNLPYQNLPYEGAKYDGASKYDEITRYDASKYDNRMQGIARRSSLSQYTLKKSQNQSPVGKGLKNENDQQWGLGKVDSMQRRINTILASRKAKY